MAVFRDHHRGGCLHPWLGSGVCGWSRAMPLHPEPPWGSLGAPILLSASELFVLVANMCTS